MHNVLAAEVYKVLVGGLRSEAPDVEIGLGELLSLYW